MKGFVVKIIRIFLWWARHISDSVGSAALAFVPAVALCAFWMGGELWLLTVAVGLPVLMAIGSLAPPIDRRIDEPSVPVRDLDDRSVLDADLDRAIAGHLNGSLNAACFVVKLDGLSALSDQLTPPDIQNIYLTLAARIRSVVRASDSVARIDTHRIGLCLFAKSQFDTTSAKDVARRFIRMIERPLRFDGKSYHFTCSVGFCLSSEAPEQTASFLLEAASIAQTTAERLGNGRFCAYDPSMGGHSTRTELFDGINIAFDNDEIAPWFQPQVDLKTGKLIGAEALARWMHPELGVIPPLEFLSAVKMSGNWHRLTDKMIERSLHALQTLRADGLDLPHVAVNFGQDDLASEDLVDRIQWQLDTYELKPQDFVVEILESVVAMGKDDQIKLNIDALAKLGCPIHLDDFGTGHASIASLREFRLDTLKVDRSFVKNVDDDPGQFQMLKTIVLMAKELKLSVLAEGAESRDEIQTLTEMGCDAVQGYGIAKPMPMFEFQHWVKSHHARQKPKAA